MASERIFSGLWWVSEVRFLFSLLEEMVSDVFLCNRQLGRTILIWFIL